MGGKRKAHADYLARQAKKNVLSDGQGARKRKPAHRKKGSERHKRAFRDLPRSRFSGGGE